MQKVERDMKVKTCEIIVHLIPFIERNKIYRRSEIIHMLNVSEYVN